MDPTLTGRLLRSQTGQLARRATHAVMPIQSANTTPKGSAPRKTSFRNSTTFVPYKSELSDDDSDEDDDDDDSDYGDTTNITASINVTPSFNNGAAEGAGAKDTSNALRNASNSVSVAPPKEKK
jgi:hypothetical protein